MMARSLGPSQFLIQLMALVLLVGTTPACAKNKSSDLKIGGSVLGAQGSPSKSSQPGQPGQAEMRQGGGLLCVHLPDLFDAYLRAHYSQRVMTAELKLRTVDQYIKFLDPSKTLLLQRDVEELKKNVGQVFAGLESSDCSALERPRQLLVERAKEDERATKEVLSAAEYKLDESVEINLDPDKRGYLKDEAERRAYRVKMIHFQISNLLLTEIKLDEAKKQVIHRYELISKRLSERSLSDQIDLFAESFAVAMDPHTSFMPQDAMEDFKIQMRLSLEGIGASLSPQDGFTVIEELIPGGGAERSGKLMPKDKIIAVAQDGEKALSVIDMDLKDVVRKIRGPKGTKVTLTILRQGDKTETFDVTIVRDKVNIKESAAKLSYETRKTGAKTFKVGVIELPSFYGGEGVSSFLDMKRLVLEARSNKVDGIVLNLAKNGGGLLDDAVKISGLFIKKGGVVATKSSDRDVQVLSDEDPETQFSGPLVVLTSRFSASASEIFAGALKDYGRAVVVGSDHTFGKGTVQVLSGIPGIGAMKVTTGMFFLPGGKSTQHAGVSSHLHLPPLYNFEEIGEAALDYSLPPQSISPFIGSDPNDPAPGRHWTPVTPQMVDKLAKLSQDRVSQDPKFAEALKEIEEAKKNKGIIKLADLRKKAQEDLKTGKKLPVTANRKERKEKAKDMEEPWVRESVNILVDMLSGKAS